MRDDQASQCSDTSNRQEKIGEKRVNDGQIGPDPDGDSYAGVAARYQWDDVDNKRRRRGNSGEGYLALLGVKSSPQQDIFVTDLDFSRCDKPEDLEIRVRHHCRNRGVVISFVKAFQLMSNCAKANCKITVNDSDVRKVLSPNFWPEYASARIWLPKPQYNAARIEAANDEGLLME